MAALTNKSPAEFYGDLLHMSNNNSGVSTSIQVVQDGLGNLSALYLGDDQLVIKPENDNTTATFQVQNQGGTSLFNIDTANSEVKAHNVSVNTQIHTWSIVGETPVEQTHHPIPCQGLGGGEFTNPAGFGTSSDPATTLTITGSASSYSPCYFRVPADITIDEIRVISSAAAASTHTYHVMQYTVITGAADTAGDLADGTVVAHNDDASPLTVGADRVSQETLTIADSTVSAGKILIAFYEAQDTDAATVQMTMRYHFT